MRGVQDGNICYYIDFARVLLVVVLYRIANVRASVHFRIPKHQHIRLYCRSVLNIRMIAVQCQQFSEGTLCTFRYYFWKHVKVRIATHDQSNLPVQLRILLNAIMCAINCGHICMPCLFLHLLHWVSQSNTSWLNYGCKLAPTRCNRNDECAHRWCNCISTAQCIICLA